VRRVALGLWMALLPACGSDDASPADSQAGDQVAPAAVADVLEVSVTGTEEAFTFAVTIASPDSGCGRFSDWWEVVRADGSLAYRRVLLHSHVTEQPFVRTGGPVPVAGSDSVWVRAHMSDAGYGGQAFGGTPAGGLSAMAWPADLGAGSGVEPSPS